MRTTRLFVGLRNSQRIRVIMDGIGFYTTVAGTNDLPFVNQRLAIQMSLIQIGKENISGLGTTYTYYDEKMVYKSIQVQVDLV